MKALKDFLTAFGGSTALDCRQAEQMMSAYIDSMTDEEETRLLEAHTAECVACRRHLQGFISLRRFISGVSAPGVPEDLALETRIRLSHARHRVPLSQLRVHLVNVLKPMTLPALAGILATFVCFAFLSDTFGSAIASKPTREGTLLALTQAQAKGQLMNQLRGLGIDDLTVDLNIDRQGKVVAANVLTGTTTDPELDQWLRDVVLLADFYPATIYGRPVPSRLILSFVGVRSAA